VLGLQIGSLCGGAILTETIFAWPGVGRWMVESIQRRDYPVLQGGALLIAGLVVAVNLVVDASYYLLNPRLRRSR
jgi:dipeptide transport system permease protein